MIIIGILLIAVGAALLFFRKKSQDRLLEMKFTKTSTVKELQDAQQAIAQEIGPGGYRQQIEVKGKSMCDAPLTGELSGQHCVYYCMSVEERYEEQYTETNAQGRTEQKTRTGNSTVASNTQSAAFSVLDSTGSIVIRPDGARIDAQKVVDKYEPAHGTMSSLSFGNFSLQRGGIGMGNRRILGYHYNESIIPLNRDLYVLGEAFDGSGSLVIQRPEEKGKPFIISIKSEEELTKGTESSITFMLIGAIFAFVSGVVLIALAL